MQHNMKLGACLKLMEVHINDCITVYKHDSALVIVQLKKHDVRDIIAHTILFLCSSLLQLEI